MSQPPHGEPTSSGVSPTPIAHTALEKPTQLAIAALTDVGLIRDNNEDASVSKFFGLETNAVQFLPSQIDPTNLIDIDSDSLTDSTGAMTRNEAITLRIAAIVTQVLPNGNLVIHGSQEVRVNFEVRELSVDGVVRPEDISSTNTVTHDQIAEARILCGGRGTLSDIQRLRYGQELFDIIYPF